MVLEICKNILKDKTFYILEQEIFYNILYSGTEGIYY